MRDAPNDAGRGVPAPSSQGWTTVALLLLLASACAVAFWPVLSNGFVDFDDGLYLSQNPHVRRGLTWEGVRWAIALPRSTETYWHPLTWLSLMLDVQLFGPSARAVHATNLALHVTASSLLFLALLRMTGRLGRSAAVALVFALHPLDVEAVAWAVERKTVLSGALGFGAILAHAWYAERPGPARYAAVGCLFGLGMLAKPTLVTLPFLLLLLDVWPLGRTPWIGPERAGSPVRPAPLRRLALEKVPLLLLAAAATFAATATGLAPLHREVPLALRLATAITNVWAYVGKALWPARLAVFYPQPAAIAGWKVAAALLLAAAVSYALVRPRVRAGPLVGWLWFLGTMVPVSGLVRNGLWPGMADRFMYLPLAGLLVGLAWLAAPAAGRTPRRRAIAASLIGAIGIAAGVRSHRYALAWRDSESLFREAVSQTDGATIMRAKLGAALAAKGRVQEARAVYEELVRVAPGLPDGYVNLGQLLHVAGDLDGAEAQYARALAVAPASGEVLYDLALVQKQRGGPDAALPLFERAVKAGFDGATAWNQLGSSYWSAGRPAEAEAAFRRALARDDAHWHAAVNLALLLDAQGRTADAAGARAEARVRAARAGENPSAPDAALEALGRAARE